MEQEANTDGDLVKKTFGEGIQVDLTAIEDDPRWPVPEIGLRAAEKWLDGPFDRVPLVVSRLEGGKYAPVSPIRSFAAHKALIEAGEEDAFTVHVCEGLPAEDAPAVHNAVEWFVESERAGDWIHRYSRVKAGLESYNGCLWLVGGSRRFFAASCGTSTAELNRIKNANKAVPDVVGLVEDGLFSFRAADNAAKLSEEKQRAIAKAVRDEGITDSRIAARVIRRFEDRKVRPVSELVLDVEALVKAVAESKSSVGVQEALRLQAVAGDLVRATCGE